MFGKSTKDKKDLRGRVPINKSRKPNPNGKVVKNKAELNNPESNKPVNDKIQVKPPVGKAQQARPQADKAQQLNVRPKEVFSDLGLDEIGLPTYKFASVSSKSKDLVDSFLIQALDYADENDNVLPFFTGSLEVTSYADYITASQSLSGPRDLAHGDDGVINLSARSR